MRQCIYRFPESMIPYSRMHGKTKEMADLFGLREEVQQDAGEVVGVVVGVAQLVGQSIEEEVAALCVQIGRHSLEDVHGRGMKHGGRAGLHLPLGLHLLHADDSHLLGRAIYTGMQTDE